MPEAREMKAYISGESRAHILQVKCITSVRRRALSSSNLTHTFAELLLYTHLRRFDCGFRISFQEHVLQILALRNGKCNKYSTIACFALYNKRVLHCSYKRVTIF